MVTGQNCRGQSNTTLIQPRGSSSAHIRRWHMLAPPGCAPSAANHTQYPQPFTHNIRSQSHTLIQARGSSSAHIAGMPPRARFGAPPPRAHIRHHIRTPLKDITATILCQLSSNNNRQQSWPTQSNNAGTCYLNSFRQHVPTETNHTDMPT